MGVLAKEIEATYEVLSKMGEGGMGAVYKVRHRFFDEIRVVKVMRAQYEANEELHQRFLDEAKRGKQLRHANLAEVLDFSIAADGTAYIVMEFIEGVNLREVVARNGGPLDYRTVIAIAEQALDALAFLHSRRFVHRDISPDNIMVTTDANGVSRVKLIDLGIAKSLESTRALTMAGKFIGKVSYASPEQFSGEVEPRSDLYALGVVLYELLTGAKPVTGEDYLSIITGHVSLPPRAFEETDPHNRVPPAVRRAVLKALEKNPNDRYPSAQAFAEALRATVPASDRKTLEVPMVTEPLTVPVADPAAATVVTHTARTASATPSRSASRSSWPMVIAVAAVLLIGAIAAYLLLPRGTAPAPAITATTAATQPQPAPATGPSSDVTVAAPVESGQLLINAFPWGEVTSVKDAAGIEQLANGRAETPLLLSLAAGDYQVALMNPNSNRSVVLGATVKANALSRCETELDRIDAGRYLEGIGR